MATNSMKVLIPMSDYGHDPTETAVPYDNFLKAGFEVCFATETGKQPICDEKMLKGITQKLLGATNEACNLYKAMTLSSAFQSPLSWSSPDFTLEPYALIFLPGGHEKGVRQLLDSPIMQKHLATYFPQTRKPSKLTVAAICHGVQALSKATLSDGKSVIHECDTTALPGAFESIAWQGTRLFMGDYYRTYGKDADSVETAVRKTLDNPEKQYKNSLSLSPFVVSDEKYNYLSGRFPNDAQKLAEAAIEMVKDSVGSS